MFKLRLKIQKSAQQMRGKLLIVARALAISGLLIIPLASASAAPVQAGSSCQLNSPKGNIQHVIYIQFDNTHFRRDNPNVPSDLEQMPHLLNFIQANGVMMSNDHTVLISHTGTGILTSLTGVYPDRHDKLSQTASATSSPMARPAWASRLPTGRRLSSILLAVTQTLRQG